MTPEHAEALAKRGIQYRALPSLLAPKVPCPGGCGRMVEDGRRKCVECKPQKYPRNEVQKARRNERQRIAYEKKKGRSE